MRIYPLLILSAFLLGGCFAKKWKQKPSAAKLMQPMEVCHEKFFV